MDRELKWYQGVNRGQWLAMLAAFLGWMFDGFEMGLYPLVARPALKEMLHDEVHQELQPEITSKASAAALATTLIQHTATGVPSAAVVTAVEATAHVAHIRQRFNQVLEERIGGWFGAFIAIFLFGAAAGGLAFGWLGDRIGRTKAMIYSVLAYALFTGVAGFAQSPWHLAIARFVAALGMGGEWSLGVALVMELWPARARPVLAGVIGAAANLGFLLIAVISLILGEVVREQPGSWRWLMFVGVLPAFLTLFIRLFVPESDKWKRAVAEAPKPRVGELFTARLWPRTVVAIGLCGVALLGTWGAVQWQNPWAEQLVESSSPGDSEVKQQAVRAKSLTQISSAGGACFGTVLAGIFAARLNRRPAYFLLCLSALLSALWLFRPAWLVDPLAELGFLPTGSSRQTFDGEFIALLFLLGFTTASFYGFFPLYLPELFPTRIRATGQGLCYNFGRIVAALGNLFGTAPLLGYFKGDYAQAIAAVTLIYLVGMMLIWFAPETHGKPLPD